MKKAMCFIIDLFIMMVAMPLTQADVNPNQDEPILPSRITEGG